MLDDRSLSIDIARYGGLINMKINGFARVAVQDGVAKDGVIHVVPDIIVPPKKLDGLEVDDAAYWDGETEMSVEELIERLEPHVAHHADL